MKQTISTYILALAVSVFFSTHTAYASTPKTWQDVADIERKIESLLEQKFNLTSIYIFHDKDSSDAVNYNHLVTLMDTLNSIQFPRDFSSSNYMTIKPAKGEDRSEFEDQQGKINDFNLKYEGRAIYVNFYIPLQALIRFFSVQPQNEPKLKLLQSTSAQPATVVHDKPEDVFKLKETLSKLEQEIKGILQSRFNWKGRYLDTTYLGSYTNRIHKLRLLLEALKAVKDPQDISMMTGIGMIQSPLGSPTLPKRLIVDEIKKSGAMIWIGTTATQKQITDLFTRTTKPIQPAAVQTASQVKSSPSGTTLPQVIQDEPADLEKLKLEYKKLEQEVIALLRKKFHWKGNYFDTVHLGSYTNRISELSELMGALRGIYYPEAQDLSLVREIYFIRNTFGSNQTTSPNRLTSDAIKHSGSKLIISAAASKQTLVDLLTKLPTVEGLKYFIQSKCNCTKDFVIILDSTVKDPTEAIRLLRQIFDKPGWTNPLLSFSNKIIVTNDPNIESSGYKVVQDTFVSLPSVNLNLNISSCSVNRNECTEKLADIVQNDNLKQRVECAWGSCDHYASLVADSISKVFAATGTRSDYIFGSITSQSLDGISDYNFDQFGETLNIGNIQNHFESRNQMIQYFYPKVRPDVYALRSGSEFSVPIIGRALYTPPQGQYDVVFVFDISGSVFDSYISSDYTQSLETLNPGSPLNNVVFSGEVLAAQKLIDRLNMDVDRIGLVSFASLGHLIRPLSKNKNEILASLQNYWLQVVRTVDTSKEADSTNILQPVNSPILGGTAYESGMSEAILALSNSPSSRAKRILFMTDGDPNGDSSKLLALSDLAARLGIQINIYVLGSSSINDINFEIARKTGGETISVPNPSDIVHILESIDLRGPPKKIVAHNATTGNWIHDIQVVADGSEIPGIKGLGGPGRFRTEMPVQLGLNEVHLFYEFPNGVTHHKMNLNVRVINVPDLSSDPMKPLTPQQQRDLIIRRCRDVPDQCADTLKDLDITTQQRSLIIELCTDRSTEQACRDQLDAILFGRKDLHICIKGSEGCG